jgi:hypothetical protein
MAVGDAIRHELLFVDVSAMEHVAQNVFDISFRGTTDLDEMPQVWAWHLAVQVWEKLGHFLVLEVLILSPSGRTLMYLFDDEGEYDAHKIEGKLKDPWPELEPHIIDNDLVMLRVTTPQKPLPAVVQSWIRNYFKIAKEK